jgi:hypothetical protein
MENLALKRRDKMRTEISRLRIGSTYILV